MRAGTILYAVVFCLGWIGLVGCGSESSQEPIDVTSERPPSQDPWADHTQGLPFVFGYEKGLAQAQSDAKPAMMFVTTTGCGWCKKLAEENFNDAEVKSLLENFVLVIVDGDTEQDAKTQLGATRGYPHIVFLSQGGEKIGECLGYKPPSGFKPIVEGALAQAGGAQTGV